MIPSGTGQGACYLAERPLGAWVEVFRRRMLLAEAEVRGRALTRAELGHGPRLADLTSRRALEFGMTALLGADENYAASQAFAVDALDAGFDGIRYLVCHHPAQRLYGVALFADAGFAADLAPSPAKTTETATPEDLQRDAARLFGYRILPTP